MTSHSTLLIFLDGVGIGKPDTSSNPFFKFHFRFLNEIFGSSPSLNNPLLHSDGKYIFPVDALLEVPGLPQSGTGQTSIFCGVNAAKIAGQHFGPFPHSTCMPSIKEKNIFKEFILKGMKAAFVNAYPKVFFDYIDSGKKRLSVTSLCCIHSGMKFNKAAELSKGKAISPELTNERWSSRFHYKIPAITPELSAKRLLRIARKNNFTAFEYFLTDHIGHGRISDHVESIFSNLDRFLFYILNNFSREDGTLIICSDHGNVEDMSIKSHTLNPALTITAGKYSYELSQQIKSLPDIKHAIMNLSN